MSFHEVRFPADLSFGALGGPERRTDVVELTSGHEERNTPWAHSRRRYDAGLGLRDLDDIENLLAFFRRGAASCTASAGRTGPITSPAGPVARSRPRTRSSRAATARPAASSW